MHLNIFQIQMWIVYASGFQPNKKSDSDLICSGRCFLTYMQVMLLKCELRAGVCGTQAWNQIEHPSSWKRDPDQSAWSHLFACGIQMKPRVLALHILDGLTLTLTSIKRRWALFSLGYDVVWFSYYSQTSVNNPQIPWFICFAASGWADQALLKLT